MREVNGILLLDKPAGCSSNQALQCVKRLFQAKKAGHGGTLDPLATGMLVICFGRATRELSASLTSDKAYEVTARLGIKTTTADAEGDVIASQTPPLFPKTRLLEVLAQFRGDITQIPPMYSALKHKGVPLYALARKGMTVDRQPRQVLIRSIQLVRYEHPHLSLSVQCGEGTYIRTLIEDIGEQLGCGAHVSQLRRTQVGHFDPANMLSLNQIEALASNGLQALDAALCQS